MKVALLGVGLMGRPMVENLSKAGHHLHIWNRSRDKISALSSIANIYDTPSEAASDVDICICMLADGNVTTDVLLEQNVLKSCKKDTLIINMGSVEPQRDKELAQIAQNNGKRYLDAPVSGGVKGAEEASLSIFVGGHKSDMHDAMPALIALGTPHHLGPNGAGQSAKLANQLIVAITIGGVAEAFKLAEAEGCDLAVLQKALQGGFADSRILVQHGERMVNANYTPGGRSITQLKDLNNARQVADERNLDLPLAKTAEAGFRSLVDDYDCGDLDHSAYFLWLTQRQT